MKLPSFTTILALTIAVSGFAEETPVAVRRLPNRGIKPSAAMDATGRLHLIYFTGPAEAGDAFYVTSTDGGASFSAPVRINSQSGSVQGVSSIRGPRLALGKDGTVHALWNGNASAQPRGPLNPGMPADSKYNGTPLIYTRRVDAEGSFEPQRNLMQKSCAVDGESDIAADSAGNVYAVWHALPLTGGGEKERGVWMSQSRDNGKSFAAERNILPKPDGVCGCCSLTAKAGADGKLAILFRSAVGGGMERPMNLLASSDGAATFTRTALDQWPLKTCPMSSESITPAARGFILAWEGRNGVQASRVELSAGSRSAPPAKAPEIAKKSAGPPLKYPSLATNVRGEILLAWTEGMGWNKGGALAWELFDATGTKSLAKGREDGVPANDCPAAVALSDGQFVIFY